MPRRYFLRVVRENPVSPEASGQAHYIPQEHIEFIMRMSPLGGLGPVLHNLFYQTFDPVPWQ